MKSRISLILLVALALTACTTPTAAPAVPPTAVPATAVPAVPPTAVPATAAPVAAAPSSNCDRSKDLYVYGTVLASIDFFLDTKNGLSAAEKDLGVKTKFVGPTDYNMEALLQAIDQAIAEKPAGIMTIGWEESQIPEINKAVDAGIPVVMTTADLPTSKRLLFVGADNYQWGVTMGKKLIEITGGKGTYAILRDPNLGNVKQRFQGLTDYVKANSELQMVAEENDRSDIQTATQAASALIQKYPDLTAFVALTGVAGPGAATALRDAGKAGKIKVLAVNRDPVVLKAIEDGEITAAFAENPSLETYYAIKILDSIRCGSVFVTANDKAAGIAPVPSYVDTGVNVITKDNVSAFKR
jgi:ribose transport system substrate-binding protein